MPAGPPQGRPCGSGSGGAVPAGGRCRGDPWRTFTRSFVGFRPLPPCSLCRGRAPPGPMTVERMSKVGPDRLVLYVEPVAIKKERPMHRHMPRCQRPEPTRRRCRHHRLAGRSRLRDRASARPPGGPGTSRTGLPPNREARVPEGAGQGRDRGQRRDPDWWGRMQSVLLCLIGGRR